MGVQGPWFMDDLEFAEPDAYQLHHACVQVWRELPQDPVLQDLLLGTRIGTARPTDWLSIPGDVASSENGVSGRECLRIGVEYLVQSMNVARGAPLMPMSAPDGKLRTAVSYGIDQQAQEAMQAWWQENEAGAELLSRVCSNMEDALEYQNLIMCAGLVAKAAGFIVQEDDKAERWRSFSEHTYTPAAYVAATLAYGEQVKNYMDRFHVCCDALSKIPGSERFIRDPGELLVRMHGY